MDELFARGRRCHGRLMMVAALRRPEGSVRALFVAGRKLGGAVVRNRARRRLREAFRSLLAEVPGGWDVALVARREATEARYAALCREMADLLGRAGVLPRAAARGELRHSA